MPNLTRIPEFARPWAERYLASTAEVSDEDVGCVGDWLAALAVERPHLVESPGRLVRMNWAQAMDAQRKWHEAIAAKTARLIAERKEFGGAPDDVETVLEQDNGFRWVRITSPDGLDYEGAAMGHCVGSGHYDEDCTILSLRDADNLPHCTVEWDEETRIVQQVQGRANQEVVERYHGMVRGLVDHLGPIQVKRPTEFGHIFVAVNGQPARLMTWRELRNGDRITGSFYLNGCTSLTHLPDGLKVCGNLNLERCTALTNLPNGVEVGVTLHLGNCTSLTHLPNDMVVGGHLFLDGCTSLTHLPDGMEVKGSLSLNGCTSLTHLPNDMVVGDHLFLERCTALTHLPNDMEVKGGLSLNGCTSLTHLPNDMVVGGNINLRGCTALTHLSDGMEVGGDIILPSGQRVYSLDEARAWFAERFPSGSPAPCLT